MNNSVSVKDKEPFKWIGGGIGTVNVVAIATLLTVQVALGYFVFLAPAILYPLEGSIMGAGFLFIEGAINCAKKKEAEAVNNKKIETVNNQEVATTKEDLWVPITRFLNHTEGSNAISESISAHWIRNAAIRIFVNPLRSFLEIVVNSLDASVPENAVGKFGMGFLSILTFLTHEETNGCEIHIETTYADENGQLQSYAMGIRNGTDNIPEILMSSIPTLETTGTTITIVPCENPFSDATLDTLSTQLVEALQFYSYGKIGLSCDGKQTLIGEGNTLLAEVTLNKDKLVVKDNGCGISKEVAQKKLFIPSASTKKEKKQISDPAAVELTPKNPDSNDSYFRVTVNGVLVINHRLKTHLAKGRSLLIRLPADTELTLARDAIEFTPKTVERIKELINTTVRNVRDEKDGYATLLALFRGLRSWENSVQSVENCGFSRYLKESLEAHLKAESIIAVPFKDSANLCKVLEKYLPNECFLPIHLELCDQRDLIESKLLERGESEISNDLFIAKKIWFVADDLLPILGEVPQVADFGFKNLLFVPISLKKGSIEEQRFSIYYRASKPGERLRIPTKEQLELIAKKLPPYVKDIIIVPQSQLKLFTVLPKEKSLLASFKDDSALSLSREIQEQIFHQQQSVCIELGYFIKCCLHFFYHFSDPNNLSLGYFVEKENNDENFINFITSRFVYYYDKHGQQFCYHRIRESSIQIIVDYFKEFPISECDDFGLDWRAIPDFEDLWYSLYDHFEEVSTAEMSRQLLEWKLDCYGVTEDNDSKIIHPTEGIIWPCQDEDLEKLLNLHGKKIISTAFIKSFAEIDWKDIDQFIPKVCFELEMLDVVLSIATVKAAVQIHGELPEPLQKAFDSFIKDLFHSHEQYVTFDDDFFTNYDSGDKKITFRRAEPFISCHLDTIIRIIIGLKNKPDIFGKLLELSCLSVEAFFLKQKENQIRTEWLFNPIQENSILAYLGFLFENGIHLDLIESLIEKAENHHHFLFLCALLTQPSLMEILKENAENPKLINAFELYAEKISMPSVDLISLMEDPNFDLKFKNRFENYIDEITVYFHSILNKTVAYKEFCLNQYQEALSAAPVFTSNQLINCFQINPSNFQKACHDNDLAAATEAVADFEDKTELNVVKQSICHGTERDVIEATLIECVQNSIDAIQGFLRKKEMYKRPEDIIPTDISLDVHLVDGQKDEVPQIVLKIEDNIGMPSLETLLIDFLIPNFSRKAADGDMIGEMGNGAYQIYRGAEVVTVKTRLLNDPSKVYLLRIIPKYDTNGEVYDLEHKCVEINDDQFWGTSISIKLHAKENDSMRSQEISALQIREYIRTILGKTFVNFPTGDWGRLLLVDAQGYQEVITVYGEGLIFNAVGEIPFKFVPMGLNNEEGLVLTKGIPFKSLANFFKEEELLSPFLADYASLGWCLVLPKGSYTPVQSRTQIHLDKSIKEQLRIFISDWLFYRLLFVDKKTGLIPHFNSITSDFPQVYPGTEAEFLNLNQIDSFNALEQFCMHHKSSLADGQSIQMLFDNAYSTIVKTLWSLRQDVIEKINLSKDDISYRNAVDAFQEESKCTYNTWIEGLDPHIVNNNIISKWFEIKIQNFFVDLPPRPINHEITPVFQNFIDESEFHELEEIEGQESVKSVSTTKAAPTPTLTGLSTKRDIAKKMVIGILQSYCTYFCKLNTGKPVPILLTYEEERYSAAYFKKDNIIVFNLAYILPSKILQIGESLLRRKPIDALDQTHGDCIFTISLGYSATMNHELEHVRREENCSSRSGMNNCHAHDKDINGKYVSFEACAASFARHAQRQGLYDEWAQSIDRLVKELGLSADDFGKLCEQITDCEKKDRKLTAHVIFDCSNGPTIKAS